MAKKTNHVSYELDSLEKYVTQLMSYLNNHPVDHIEDRIQMLTSNTGNPIIKVIATKEQQLKAFTETLSKVPKLLEDLNALRRTVSDDEEQHKIRGDAALPGFMLESGYHSDKELSETVNNSDDDYVEEIFDEE